jgi:hypothetical protein
MKLPVIGEETTNARVLTSGGYDWAAETLDARPTGQWS